MILLLIMIMNDIRKLIYEEKSSLNAFDVKKHSSLNKRIYDLWLIKRKEIDPFDAKCYDNYLRAFNDAYYVCTLIMLWPIGHDLYLHKILSTVDRPSVVFPMVHLYLSKLPSLTEDISRLLNFINAKYKLNQDWEQNYNDLQKVIGNNFDIEPNMFAQRSLTPKLLLGINWKELTANFDKGKIKWVVRSFSKNKEVWQMMCKAIKEAAQKYDFDSSFEEYEQDAYDENGCPYTEIVLVPRSQFDSWGNDISNPLKRAGVYDFCDNLMEQHDELSVISQAMVLKSTEGTVTGQVPEVLVTPQKEIWDDSHDNVFDDKLNVQAIADDFSSFNEINLTLKQKAYVLYRVLEENRWIPKKRGSQKNYIKWYKMHIGKWDKDDFGSDFSIFNNVPTSDWSRESTPHSNVVLFKQLAELVKQKYWDIDDNNKLKDKNEYFKEGKRHINL